MTNQNLNKITQFYVNVTSEIYEMNEVIRMVLRISRNLLTRHETCQLCKDARSSFSTWICGYLTSGRKFKLVWISFWYISHILMRHPRMV